MSQFSDVLVTHEEYEQMASDTPPPIPTSSLAVTVEELKLWIHNINNKLLTTLVELNSVQRELTAHGYDLSTSTLPLLVPWSIDFQNLLLKKEYLDKVLDLNCSYLRYLEGVQTGKELELEQEQREDKVEKEIVNS